MRSLVAITISTAFVFTASSAHALQGRGQGPKVKTTTSAPKVQGSAKVTGPKAPTTKVHTKGPKSTAKVHAHGPKTTTSSGSRGGSKKSATASGTQSKKSSTSTSSAQTTANSKRTTTTSDQTTLTPVQQKLQRNTNLANKLEGRLPAGTDLMTAADGFRNLGQFVAAVNVSNNLGIPFRDLKTRMVDEGMSLGQAIKAERPKVDSTVEARRAESEATRVIESSGATDSTSGTAPQAKKTKSTKGAKGRR